MTGCGATPGRRTGHAGRFAVAVCIAAAVYLAVTWLPTVALACPVCRDPRADNEAAFVAMTVFMSLLPLALIGSIAGFFWTAAKRAERDGEQPPAS